MKLLIASLISTTLIIGCAATPNSDGSTTVKLSIPGMPQPAKQTDVNLASVTQQPSISNATANTKQGTPISATSLAGIFSKNPWNGSTDPYYPKVALTIRDWSSNCWTADAVIWRSATKSENVDHFYVCGNNSLGAALNGAAGLHLFLEQVQTFNHTGNLRTTGPKPPQFAVNMNETSPDGFTEFVEALLAATGWQAGPVDTSMWIVAYKK